MLTRTVMKKMPKEECGCLIVKTKLQPTSVLHVSLCFLWAGISNLHKFCAGNLYSSSRYGVTSNKVCRSGMMLLPSFEKRRHDPYRDRRTGLW